MSYPLYLNDTYLFASEQKIISSAADEKGPYLVFDQTIFYPQGGGQPSDQGMVEIGDSKIPVHFVKQVEAEIRHYVKEVSDQWTGADVKCSVDNIRRMLNARYHTAAHLLSNVVEDLSSELKAVKGHSFPGEAYVEFMGNGSIQTEILQETLNKAVQKELHTTGFDILPTEFEEQFYKLPYPIPSNKAFRAMQIGNYPPIPCGGTHIARTSEIGSITLRKIVQKNDRTKVSYEI